MDTFCAYHPKLEDVYSSADRAYSHCCWHFWHSYTKRLPQGNFFAAPTRITNSDKILLCGRLITGLRKLSEQSRMFPIFATTAAPGKPNRLGQFKLRGIRGRSFSYVSTPLRKSPVYPQAWPIISRLCYPPSSVPFCSCYTLAVTGLIAYLILWIALPRAPNMRSREFAPSLPITS